MENLVMNQKFWKGRRVFLTGHTGFKGSWLTLMLQMLGAEVHGYALAPDTDPALFTVANVANGMKSQIADIRDLPTLRSAIAAANPEIVLHLAAQAIVSESFDAPLATFDTNVMGTANLLEAVRSQSSVKTVIIVTSDKCYENRNWMWSYREGEPLGGNDPYSASKACAEMVVSSYRYSFFDKPEHPAIATARAGNVIGGGDWSRDRLIPDIIRSFIRNESVLIRSPNSIRPWQHVLEPLYGYLLLAERCSADRKFADAWNFGPDQLDAQPVNFIANSLVRMWGNGAAWHTLEQNSLKEAYVLKLDSTKARSLLQWQPATQLTEALQLTADWYKSYISGDDPRASTERQIKAFLNRS